MGDISEKQGKTDHFSGEEESAICEVEFLYCCLNAFEKMRVQIAFGMFPV